MEMVWVALVEGLLTLAGVCVTVRMANKKSTEKMEAKVDKLVEHDEEQYLAILRLTIMAEDMPISERIIAGDKYIKLGGNGDVKQYYLHMLAEHTK